MSRALPEDDPDRLRLVVLHRLPGRLRVGLWPARRSAVEHLVAHARELAGVRSAEAGASGRNMVVRFNHDRLGEDALLTRLAFEHAADNGFLPVEVVRERGAVRLDAEAVRSGVAAALASATQAGLSGTALASFTGWLGAGLTLRSVGESVLRGVLAGEPRPEGLALLHLLSSLGSPSRGYGALLTWVIYHGPALAEMARGVRDDAFEVQARPRPDVVGDERGRHVELVVRPVESRGTLDGRLLTPTGLVSAALGYLVFAIGQRSTTSL